MHQEKESAAATSKRMSQLRPSSTAAPPKVADAEANDAQEVSFGQASSGEVFPDFEDLASEPNSVVRPSNIIMN